MVGRMKGWEAPQEGWRKGPWTAEEDTLLTEYVNLHGEGRWSSVSRCAGLNRSAKSCRLRWVNYLRPGLKRGHITPQEEGIIIELHALWGNKWSTIARYLPGRTDNEIKNYWRTHFKKKERSSMKQEKRKAQVLKLQQQQKQEDPKLDNHEDEIMKRVLPEYQTDKVADTKVAIQVSDVAQQGKQTEMVFMYPASEDECLPVNDVMSQEAAAAANNPWLDECLLDEALWGGLWNLDFGDHEAAAAAGNCNKTALQTQPTVASSFGGEASNFYNGGYIF